LDAAVRVIYRFFVSRKNFLNWTTAFEGDGMREGSLRVYYRRFLSSALTGAFFFAFPMAMAKIFGVIWMTFPLFAWLLSRERKNASQMESDDREKLLGYMADAWAYFRDHVNEKTRFLPPDNVQFSPTYAIAMRTSPTNVGMYLLSLLAARDFDLIGKDELLHRAQSAAETLESLRKWNGHLYNWYVLQTLSVLDG
jgi:cyclic beta-1,2-glucan synthetase